MKQYQTFIFDSYSYDPETGRIELVYSLDGQVRFVETLLLPIPRQWNTPSSWTGLFLLHLIGGVSYYKTCVPKTIEVRSGKLTEEQANMLSEIYTKGLGEFFYVNDINFLGLVNFPLPPARAPAPLPFPRGGRPKALVPLGGGKDSLVTVEILRDAGIEMTLFRMGSHPLIEEEAAIAELPLLAVKRMLSPALFELNEQGALNGHVPITAYLSAVTTVMAIVYGYDTIVMSDERSAEEGNVTFHGAEINHQWSKSLAFERLFQEYLQTYLTPDIDYFSILRPMSELAIAKLFAMHPEYFGAATSCNKNWKILSSTPPAPSSTGGGGARWCGTCPKCAFVFAILAAFLTKKDLLGIFGKNLYEDEALLPLYRELLGLEGVKPFECVGTPEETSAAFLLALERGELEKTPVMQMFLLEKAGAIEHPLRLVQSCLTFSHDHAIPDRFEDCLNVEFSKT